METETEKPVLWRRRQRDEAKKIAKFMLIYIKSGGCRSRSRRRRRGEVIMTPLESTTIFFFAFTFIH
jgi:hypothetical protein